MNASSINSTVPSESDDTADDSDLPPGQVWAYPCRLPTCPSYGKHWLLRSEFLLHLQEEAHMATAATPAIRRAIEIEWRDATDPDLPPRRAPDFRSREDPDEYVWNYSFRDENGNVVDGEGTLHQWEMHRNARRRQAGKT